jgi:hypothetical protein
LDYPPLCTFARGGCVVFKLCNAPRFWGAIWCATFLLSIFVVGAHATTADDVRKKIDELKATLAAFDGKNSVAADINGLRKLLLDKKLIGGGAADAFIQYSGEIQTLLSDNETRLLIRDKAIDSVNALSTALDGALPDVTIEERFAKLLTGVTALIGASAANQVLLTTALLQDKTKPVPMAREQFDTAWAKITDADYKIHVVRSWFGDLRTVWRESRLCTSTSAMKAQCEAKTECSLLPGTAPAPFNQESLCGFDPAPLADIRFKGVVVNYTCVRGGKQVWNEVAQYPGTDPTTRAAWTPRDINQAVLRSNAMSIRCPFPVAK